MTTRSFSAVSRGACGLVVAACALAGCSLNGVQSALDPAGPQARRLEGLWWLAFWLATAAWALTVLALLYAAFHRNRRAPRRELELDEPRERRSLRAVVVATGATVAVLLAFLVADLVTSRSLAALQAEPALSVRVTGFQWWWKVEYPDSAAHRTVVTANELHIPVGRPVRIETRTGDVIHSFWVPALHGKRDLVPGLRNHLWIRADTAGVYRGECAEFCGHQHAKMALLVIAHPQAEFDRWYAGQLAPAAPPADSVARAGLRVFETRSCAMCHQVRGTRAAGQFGPDLTHLATRRTIAAGTLPNTRGWLGGWIMDPQAHKPGTRMPANDLTAQELRALLAYLEGLR